MVYLALTNIMHSEVKDVLEVRRKLVVLNYAKACDNAAQPVVSSRCPKLRFTDGKEPTIKMDVPALFVKKTNCQKSSKTDPG